MEIIRRKTGALIATSCRLGGMLSETPHEYLDVLEEFGEALGMAFQPGFDESAEVNANLEPFTDAGIEARVVGAPPRWNVR